MRKIKLRGLVINPLASGEAWITSDDEFHEVYINYVKKAVYINGHAVEFNSISRYTGLKDKNGVEIYEGDIGWDEHFECFGVIKFDEGKFTYDWDNISEDLFEVHDEVKIIGNIYEHSHLLKEELQNEK